MITILLFFYILFNLFHGERGLLSYIDNKKKIIQLNEEKIILTKELNSFSKKNLLLSENIDLDCAGDCASETPVGCEDTNDNGECGTALIDDCGVC